MSEEDTELEKLAKEYVRTSDFGITHPLFPPKNQIVYAHINSEWLQDGFIQGYKACREREVPRWVSVKEGFPPKNVLVLVKSEIENEFRLARYLYKDGDRWWFGVGGYNITHWIYLPFLPKEPIPEELNKR